MQLEKLKPALYLQFTHIALAIIWNVAGVALIAAGLRSPGPTASMAAAFALFVVGVVLFYGARRWISLYVLATLLAAAAATFTIFQAFTADPSLWPSEFWRYAGILLNALGVVGGLLGMTILARTRIGHV